MLTENDNIPSKVFSIEKFKKFYPNDATQESVRKQS